MLGSVGAVSDSMIGDKRFQYPSSGAIEADLSQKTDSPSILSSGRIGLSRILSLLKSRLRNRVDFYQSDSCRLIFAGRHNGVKAGVELHNDGGVIAS